MIIIEDWNNDREFRLMFCSRWRSFDPADDLELTAIVDCRIEADSENTGKRLTKLQRRLWISVGMLVKSLASGRFSLALCGIRSRSLLAILESIFV
jgi:hypothetical protein